MTKGTLENGFEYEVDETLLDDMEFLEVYADAISGEDSTAVFKVIKQMFPGEKKKQLYDFARDPKTKRVPPFKVGEIVGAVVEAVRKDGKNS